MPTDLALMIEKLEPWAPGEDLPVQLDTLLADGAIEDYLAGMQADPTDTDRLTARRHPNGFVKIVLLPADDRDYSMRLHYWTDPPRFADIHSHAWDFASHVLVGALEESTYLLAPGDGPWQTGLCTKVDKQYAIRDLRPCALRLASSTTYSAGSTYYRPYADLHQAKAVSLPTVTAVLCGPRQCHSTRVVLPPSPGRGPLRREETLSADELATVVTEVLALLSPA